MYKIYRITAQWIPALESLRPTCHIYILTNHPNWKSRFLRTKLLQTKLTFDQTFKNSTTTSDECVHFDTKDEGRTEGNQRKLLLLKTLITEICFWRETCQSNTENNDASFSQVSCWVDDVIAWFSLRDKEYEVRVASRCITKWPENGFQGCSRLSCPLLRFGDSVAKLAHLVTISKHNPVRGSVLAIAVGDDGDVGSGEWEEPDDVVDKMANVIQVLHE